MKRQKVYELTTNAEGGFVKHLVIGLKNDTEARKLAKQLFKRFYWDKGISYYDDYPSKYGNSYVGVPTVKQLKQRLRESFY
jgi:hypothetical protein